MAGAPTAPPVPAVPAVPSPGPVAGSPPPRSPTPPRAATTVARVAPPEEVYRAALDDYVKGKYDLAMAGFHAYVTTYPEAAQVGSARYWLGETYLAQKRYREALQEFELVLKDFSKSEKAPSALLKKAFVYRDLGQPGETCAALREVTQKFKGSREARIAQGEIGRANCR
jgi:tol-pal system protein YbgF